MWKRQSLKKMVLGKLEHRELYLQLQFTKNRGISSKQALLIYLSIKAESRTLNLRSVKTFS